MHEDVKAYYEGYNEDIRLFRSNRSNLEFQISVHYFDKLFSPKSRILDACAGTGAYSFYLADKGHMVTACDLSPHHINIMKSKPDTHKLEDIAVCDILDLSRFADNSFDVVLCMGALYHLHGNYDKNQAVSECERVCKPGGIVVLAYITKIGAVLTNIQDDASNMDRLMKFIDGYNDDLFTHNHPHEIDAIAANCRLDMLHHVGVDLIYPVSDKLNNALDEDCQKYLDFHLKVCEEPSFLGASIHGLWIGRKLFVMENREDSH